MKRSASGHAVVDVSKLEWLGCGHCDGKVAREGKDLYHSFPACQGFLDAIAGLGGKLEHVKDSSLN